MTKIEDHSPSSMKDLNLQPRGKVHPSPDSWRDQIFYFLLPDRFSTGQEDPAKLFDWRNPAPCNIGPDTASQKKWREAGKIFQGGTLKGIESKLGYLKEMGITTLWIGPVWRQRKDIATYHGYATQNFLDVDPHFGTRQDLRDLVDAAHALGIYVILDIVYNHTGDNWSYCVDGKLRSTVSYRYSPPYPFGGWRSATGTSIPDTGSLGPNDGVWPAEIQHPDCYLRAGEIGNWNPVDQQDPLDPESEFRRGDIYSLKKLDLGEDKVLDTMVKIYQYWIALSDCDGFRIDSLKHVTLKQSRAFSARIHEFAEEIGKERFFLVGEVAGGAEMVRAFLEIHGYNIDAVLDITQAPMALANMVKGLDEPAEFFRLFDRRETLGLHRKTGLYHISILDDHDLIWRQVKERFAAHNNCAACHQQVAHAVGVQLTTLGIPCIYYGTEQAFDGTERRGLPHEDHKDRYLREAMFGGDFGAFQTAGCHFFNADHPAYLRIAAIARIRNAVDRVGTALRRGRQYERETSVHCEPFGASRKGELVAWSRIHDGPEVEQEVLVVLNTHGNENRSALVTVDRRLHPANSKMEVCYSGAWTDEELKAFILSGATPPAPAFTVIDREGRSVIEIELPPAGMMILARRGEADHYEEI